MKKFLFLSLAVIMILSFSACGGNGSEKYDIGNADRARIFYDTYESFVETYGEAKAENGTLYGTAAVRLDDFTGDGYPELLMVYSSEKDGKVDRVVVGSFDMGYGELYNEEITSKANGVPSLWIYTDSADQSYLVMGEDLTKECVYLNYQQADKEGKPLYKFAEAFTTVGDTLSGEYEKINLTENDDAQAVVDKNKGVVNAMKSQKN